ncbi:MAG: hypothetical protein Ta2B_01610 [Termitinemataceae bacterium]|nr:MAG: hypothetical protein Ta2B_01610 [Termitinemataceae bacterium]
MFKTNTVEIAGKEITFDQKRYEDRIHAIALGDKSGTHVLLGSTPEIYEELGFKNLPMMISRKHIENIMHKEVPNMDENYHGLSEDILKQIPQQLKNPIAIIQSDTDERDVVSIVELKDQKNRAIIIPIAQNIRDNYLNVDINRIKSIYGRNNFDRWFKKTIKEDRLLYLDKEKSRTLLHSGRDLRQSDASKLVTGNPANARQDISGFYINNIARLKEIINQNKHLCLNTEKLRVLIDQQRSNLADVEYLNLEPIDRLLQENKNVKRTILQTFKAILKSSTKTTSIK